MTLQQLKYVVTVAETGTITEAANRLYISQPSLTNAIRELEKRKSQIDYMVEKRKYAAAIRGYDMLLETWNHLEQEGKELPAGKRNSVYPRNTILSLSMPLSI